MKIRKPSAPMLVATLSLAVAVGGGTAFAASSALPHNSVGTQQLKNGAVTNAKIATHTIGTGKLTPGAVKALKGARGPAGPRGATGPAGPAGASAAGAPIKVTSLTGAWTTHNGADEGTATIDANGVELGGSATNGGLTTSDDTHYAGVGTTVFNGVTPSQLTSVSYTETYTMPTDSHRAAPYFKFKLQPAGGQCGDDDIVYNPSVQSSNLDYSDQASTYDVTAPYSTIGVNNDANPVDGSYVTAIHSTSNSAGKDVSSEPICFAEVILGGGSDATDAKATLSSISFSSANMTRDYVFGN